ncbi:MAG: TcpE family conjugal transfer membrane protein [Aminipila sp.]
MQGQILRSYRKVWKFERKLYAIDDIKLPIPINPDEAVYFALGIFITIGLLKILPFLNAIPFIVRYMVFPYGLMKFLTKKKFDGKLPHRFLIGYFDYLGQPKKIARFKPSTTYKKGYFAPVVYRRAEIINLTASATSKKRGGKKSCINSQ